MINRHSWSCAYNTSREMRLEKDGPALKKPPVCLGKETGKQIWACKKSSLGTIGWWVELTWRRQHLTQLADVLEEVTRKSQSLPGGLQQGS